MRSFVRPAPRVSVETSGRATFSGNGFLSGVSHSVFRTPLSHETVVFWSSSCEITSIRHPPSAWGSICGDGSHFVQSNRLCVRAAT